jgi:hypothetical protein
MVTTEFAMFQLVGIAKPGLFASPYLLCQIIPLRQSVRGGIV